MRDGELQYMQLDDDGCTGWLRQMVYDVANLPSLLIGSEKHFPCLAYISRRSWRP